MGTKVRVVEIARRICTQFAQGNRGGIQIGQIHFELSEVARCSEFVRECVEAAAETANHGSLTKLYFGGSARETETKLQSEGKRVPAHKAEPGDIVCFNLNAGRWGHIGIYLGNRQFAENTSSKGRGPGFVISTFEQIEASYPRISGFYSVLPSATPLEVWLLPGSIDIKCRPRVEEGTTRVDVRAIAEALGYEVLDRIREENRVLIRPR